MESLKEKKNQAQLSAQDIKEHKSKMGEQFGSLFESDTVDIGESFQQLKSVLVGSNDEDLIIDIGMSANSLNDLGGNSQSQTMTNKENLEICIKLN